jgi:hypothetical protein
MRSLFRNLRGGCRLSFLGRVRREDFDATGEAFAALVILNLAFLFFPGFGEVGLKGQLSYPDLQRALMIVPLILAFGLIVARITRKRAAALDLPIALMSAAVTISVVAWMLGMLLKNTPFLARYGQYAYYLPFAWWAAAIAAAAVRLTPPDPARRLGVVVAGVVTLLAPAWWLPQGSLWIPAPDPGADASHWTLADEKGYYAQPDVLAGALGALEPGRPGIPDLYLVAAGLYARENVFMKEVMVIEELFRERFDADGRTLVLINNPGTVDSYPVASLTSLAAGLRRVGEVMDRGEDVLVLYLSSHGSDTHRLSVDFWPLRLDPIDPPALKKVLDEAGVRWKVVVVSACYSGGFVEPLKDDFTAVITASSATRQSFGCGSASDSTYLAKALFDEELRRTYSFEKAFENARKSIEERERSQGFVPSEPQIHIGPALRGKLAEIERRLAAREPAPAGGGSAR